MTIQAQRNRRNKLRALTLTIVAVVLGLIIAQMVYVACWNNAHKIEKVYEYVSPSELRQHIKEGEYN